MFILWGWRNEGTIYVNNPVSNFKSDIKVNINKEKAQGVQ